MGVVDWCGGGSGVVWCAAARSRSRYHNDVTISNDRTDEGICTGTMMRYMYLSNLYYVYICWRLQELLAGGVFLVTPPTMIPSSSKELPFTRLDVSLKSITAGRLALWVRLELLEHFTRSNGMRTRKFDHEVSPYLWHTGIKARDGGVESTSLNKRRWKTRSRTMVTGTVADNGVAVCCGWF